MKTSETLQAVINTLDKIPVCGFDNMDKMLGCMQTLVSLKRELETTNETE